MGGIEGIVALVIGIAVVLFVPALVWATVIAGLIQIVRDKMVEMKQRLYYDQHHSYARLEDGFVVQGLTDPAQKMLGETLYVELPYIGRKVRQGDRLLSVQPLNEWMRVWRIHATVSGEVAAVNQVLADEPDIINDDPYGTGWLVKIKPTDLTELENLQQEKRGGLAVIALGIGIVVVLLVPALGEIVRGFAEESISVGDIERIVALVIGLAVVLFVPALVWATVIAGLYQIVRDKIRETRLVQTEPVQEAQPIGSN
jgi:glycine cleavage system H protein